MLFISLDTILNVVKQKDILSAFPSNHTPREQQAAVLKKIEKFLRGNKKYLILCAPTGSGKSYISRTVANLTDSCSKDFKHLVDSYSIYQMDQSGEFSNQEEIDKQQPFGSMVLTISKNLQNQYKEFFNDSDILKGKSNYQCTIDETKDVEIAPCVVVGKIKDDCWKKCICPYYEARNRVVTSNFGILNYSMFLALPDELKRKELLICDEAAELEDELVKRFGFDISYERLAQLGIHTQKLATDVPNRVIEWLTNLLVVIEEQIKILTEKRNKKELSDAQQNKLRGLNNVVHSVKTVTGHWNDCKYVIEKSATAVNFSPLKVDKLSSHIFDHGEKVILMSATIIDPVNFAKSLGIEEYEYVEMPSSFDPKKAPIYVHTKYKLNHANLEQNLPHVCNIAKELVDKYKNDKGIIHTHSFKITEYVKAKFDDYGDRMLYRQSGKTNEDIVKEHVESDKPTVLVSPSLTHGVDLKDELARFQIVLKLPYLPLGSKRVETLFKLDPEWYENKMLSSLVQACGRGIRTEEDHCDTYILDGAIKFVLMKCKDKLPQYFIQRFQ